MPNDWNFTAGAVVTVPVSATPGVYRARYGDGDTMLGGGRGYEFEVVCMTVEISVEKTFIDDDTYRLTCTATPQGRAAPYEYDWSSSVPGSTVISGQDTQTLVVEIVGTDQGAISVIVNDSGNPPCTASGAYTVCQFQTHLYASLESFPIDESAGPYVYRCSAGVLDGLAPFNYQWTPTPQSIEDEGQKAMISFADGNEYTIELKVTDAQGCISQRQQTVGGFSFTLFLDTGEDNAGRVTGSRDTMQFDVEIEALWRGATGQEPAQVQFQAHRYVNAQNYYLNFTANLETGSSPPRYRASWPVTTEKGFWTVTIPGYTVNPVSCKINKRAQIVQVAES